MSVFTTNQRVWLVAVFLAVVGLFSPPVFAKTAAPECGRVESRSSQSHVVRSGEILSSILAKRGFRKLWCAKCAVASTASFNQLDDANRLMVGQILKIPSKRISIEHACVQSSAEAKRKTASETVQATSETDEAKVFKGEKPFKKPMNEPMNEPQATVAATSAERVFQSEIFFGLPFHSLALEGTDRTDKTKGKLLTGANPGIELAWRVRFTEKWQAEIGSRFESATIQPDINSVNIDGREQKIGVMSANVRYGSNIRLGLGVKSRDRLVYRAAAGPGIRVQTLPSQAVAASFDATLARFSQLSVSSGFRYESFLSDSSISQGSAIAGRFILRQDFEKWAIEGEFGYESTSYQTTLLDVSGSDLWLTWGLVWKL